MVLLTVVTNSNPHTLYFDHPIEKPRYIRLLSASLYNSWHNLKEESVIYADNPNRTLEAKLLPGHYTVDALVKEFNALSPQNPKFVLSAKANTAVGVMIINGGNTRFSHGLLQLLGIQKLSPITLVKRLTAPSTYFVHCDLIDKRQNLLKESLRLSWHDSIFEANHLKRFITNQHNNMFCVKRTAATTM